MQPVFIYDYTNYMIPTPINEEITRQSERMIHSDKQELKKFLTHIARKLRYKSKRTQNYINKLNYVLDQLNDISSETLASITSHKFYITIRNLIRDLLHDWYLSSELSEDESYLLQNCIFFFDRLVNTVDDVTKLTTWLIDPSLINSLTECMTNIDQLLSKNNDKRNFKQLIRLFDLFHTYYRRLPLKAHDDNRLDRLYEATMDCLVSSNYERAFRKLKSNTQSLNSEQKFFLIKCPSFFSSYQGSQSAKIIEQLLETMVPRYASLLDKHIQSIKEWKSPIIHAVHHLLLTVVHVQGHYASYANGQPLKWLIDHIIHIISESSFIEKVHARSTIPETVLIDSALRTLTEFVHEPDLLVYIKQSKITPIFRSLILLPNESIVLHAYVMLAYTLDEDDIKASEKDAGRLLSKIFDSLRKKIKSLSDVHKNSEVTQRNISLLIEAIRALVQHDQIKSEIIKQNALPLLVHSCEYLSDQSKRLVLDTLGSITFDEEAARLLRDDTRFIQSIEDMQQTSEDGIKKAAEKILWNLVKEPEREKKTIKEKIESEDKKEDKTKKDEYQHDIMISYCHADKEMVYRIHKYLSDKGFKIWVDRDNIYGPAMQAMADAVENSEFVILCMSDSYKRSVYCQAEAEYAFRCKRHLLPIIVRQGYRADGWLGLLIGSRIYVDFGRLEFKQACDLMIKEITLQRESQLNNTGSILGGISNDRQPYQSSQDMSPLTAGIGETKEQSKLPVEYIKRNTTKSTYRSTSVNQWMNKDILDFLYDTRLHYMMPICELMTGHGLIKLFRICQAKPSRFYNRLNDELTSRFNGLHLPIGIFTQFLSEMDQLINSSSIEAIEQDALSSKSSLSSPMIVTHTSKSSSPSILLEPIQEPSIQIISPIQALVPTITTIQTSRNVQITEQTAYRTESIVTPVSNYTVRTSDDASSIRSKQTELTATDN